MQLPRGREEGRKRSLTDVLKIEGEEERGRVALELSRWVSVAFVLMSLGGGSAVLGHGGMGVSFTEKKAIAPYALGS